VQSGIGWLNHELAIFENYNRNVLAAGNAFGLCGKFSALLNIFELVLNAQGV
jgi:hypothetical protein